MQLPVFVLALAFIIGAVHPSFGANDTTPRGVTGISEKAIVSAKTEAARMTGLRGHRTMAAAVQLAANSKAECVGKTCEKKAAKETFILSRTIYKSHKRCKPVGCKYVNYHVFSARDERYEVARKLTVFGPSGRVITEAVEKKLRKTALIIDGAWSFDQEADLLTIRAKSIRDKLDNSPIRPEANDNQQEIDQ